MLGYACAQIDIEGILGDAWKLIAMAARYGHQPISELMEMTFEQLDKFTDALSTWIEKENKSGRHPGPGG